MWQFAKLWVAMNLLTKNWDAKNWSAKHLVLRGTSIVACCLFLTVGGAAQDSKPETKKAMELQSAVIAFEFKTTELLQHPIARLVFKDAKDEMRRLLKASRIVGFFAVPSDPRSLQNMTFDQRIPFEFAMTVEFSTKSDRLSALDDDVLANLERVSSKGKTYYTVPSDDSNLAMLVGDTTVQIGTSNYLFRDHRELMTSQLTAAFDGIAPAPIRVAMDFGGASEFLNASLAIARKQKPPAWAIPFLDLPKKIEVATLSVDPSRQELVNFSGRSANANDSKFIKNTLDALVGLAQLKLREDKNAPPLAILLLKSTKIESQELTTALIVTKPENLDEVVSQTK